MDNESKFSHSVKNPNIVHFLTENDGRPRYLCNGACSVTPSKSTKDLGSVTCKNCLTRAGAKLVKGCPNGIMVKYAYKCSACDKNCREEIRKITQNTSHAAAHSV